MREALAGRFRTHHGLLVAQLLAHIDYLDETIEALSHEVERVLTPFAEMMTRLDTIPGIDRRGAEVLIAELGVDMTVFPTDRHVASWAGMCPGQHESAGKRQSGKSRPGNRWLRSALIESALASIRKRDCAFGSRYRRLLRHRGHKKAVFAVAHAILVTAYHVLARGTTYQELGANYYDQRNTERITRQAVRALEGQGYRVTLEHAA